MQGQWIGQASGTNNGTVVLDLESRGHGYQGYALLFDNDPALPGTMVRIVTDDHQDNYTLDLIPLPLWRDGALLPREDMEKAFPGVNFPNKCTISLKQDGDYLAASWSTDVGTAGKALLFPSEADSPSALVPEPEITTWDEFKRFALALPSRDFIFRGQPSTQRLRTSFHRTWRKDLGRYVEEDISALRLTLAGQTKHFFRHENPLENAAFWNLLQHHGYPTPLLDWSYSPFVAAYFAFRSFRRTPEFGEVVRIYIFDRRQWRNDWREFTYVAYTPPHLTVIDALVLDNPRALPQQALSTVTNCDDVEGFVEFSGNQSGHKYLRCVDIQFTERHSVLNELTAMGITAGSLFPGIDGACEQIKQRLFGFNT